MIKISLCGFGKMNREVFNTIQANPSFQVVSILEPHTEKNQSDRRVPTASSGVCAHSVTTLQIVDAASSGVSNPQFVNAGTMPAHILVTDNPETAFNSCDVVIDFSTASSVLGNAEVAATLGKNIVIGTTGLDQNTVEKLRSIFARYGTSSVIASNFSIGVNIFLQTAELLSKRLPNYGVEIIDVHHQTKKDAPSGTALRTKEALARQGEVPIHSLRLGDVIGDHAVIFGGNAERIELWHRATSRSCFAQGALLAAKWLSGKRDGKIYTFKDVLSA